MTSNKTTSQHRGFWFDLSDTSGHLEAAFGDNTGATSAQRRSKVTSGANAVTTGAWQHVACCIRGAGNMDVYIGGADAGGSYSGSGSGMVYNGAIGGRIGSVGGNLFDGRIAEVGLWTVTLSAAEVLALAKGVPPRRIRPGSLVAHWPLYGYSPEIDLSSNALNTTADAGARADHAPVGPPASIAA